MHVKGFIYKKTDLLVPVYFLSSQLPFLILLVHALSK